MYVATLKHFTQTFQAKGATVAEAILNLKPGTINGRVILTLAKDTHSRERIISPALARKLFNTAGISREAALKNTTLLFQGF
jgi:hypothetical protein